MSITIYHLSKHKAIRTSIGSTGDLPTTVFTQLLLLIGKINSIIRYNK
ncbi:hypothetical protein [Neobacillus vireti]